MTGADIQFGRRASLIVAGGADALDLSDFHFRFQVLAADSETPNTAVIRIYNLADVTVRKMTAEYTRVILQAGYDAAFGVIFDGTIKQYRVGKENTTDKYLDILAADADLAYNFGVVNATLAAGTTPVDRAKATAEAMGLSIGQIDAKILETSGIIPQPRGKVLWGMGRAHMRNIADTLRATWNINGGKVNITGLQGYLPGEAVVLSAATGMIGIPEQTDQGVKVRTLLNPRLRLGGLVQIDNALVNQIKQADLRADGTFTERKLPQGQINYNSWGKGVSFPANVTDDGFYRAYVIEYVGDTRGNEWYSDVICLAVDISAQQVRAAS